MRSIENISESYVQSKFKDYEWKARSRGIVPEEMEKFCASLIQNAKAGVAGKFTGGTGGSISGDR